MRRVDNNLKKLLSPAVGECVGRGHTKQMSSDADTAVRTWRVGDYKLCLKDTHSTPVVYNDGSWRCSNTVC